MTLFLSSFLSFILLYKYWALFILTVGASFLLPIPMNAILVAMGAFASQGYINGSAAFFLILGTNVATDSFAFFLTYKYGNIIIDKFIPKWERKIFNIEKYLKRYAFGTIFLTRIAGPFAPTVNFLSGLTGISYPKFLLADFLGNGIGAVFFFFAGYVLGNYWQTFLDETWVITTVISALFIGYVVYKTIRKKRADE